MSEESVQKRFPTQVVVMVTILVAVLAAGFLMVPRTEEQRLAFVERMGTTNNGTLLHPAVELSSAGWVDDAGRPWAFRAEEPRWHIVLPVGDVCDEACEELLYITRQIHIRLGKQADRLARVYVNVGGPLSDQQRQFLSDEHPRIQIVHYSADEFSSHFEGTNGEWNGEFRSYLVDPHGIAMMYHDAGLPGGSILKDLNHLLKLSSH